MVNDVNPLLISFGSDMARFWSTNARDQYVLCGSTTGGVIDVATATLVPGARLAISVIPSKVPVAAATAGSASSESV